jgi:hypothetical protein
MKSQSELHVLAFLTRAHHGRDRRDCDYFYYDPSFLQKADWSWLRLRRLPTNDKLVLETDGVECLPRGTPRCKRQSKCNVERAPQAIGGAARRSGREQSSTLSIACKAQDVEDKIPALHRIHSHSSKHQVRGARHPNRSFYFELRSFMHIQRVRPIVFIVQSGRRRDSIFRELYTPPRA